MTRDEIVDEILELAAEDPDALLELSAASAHAELYDAATEELGGWDAALAAALARALETGESGRESGAETGGEESILRQVGSDAREPIFAATETGAFFKIVPGTELAVGDDLRHIETPAGSGNLVGLAHVGDPEGLVLFTNRGHYFAMAPGMVPKWKGSGELRRLEHLLELERGEVVQFVLPRRAFYGGRIVHVTEGGKGKATEASEYEYATDHDARLAFLLDEGDHPVSVMAVPEGSGVFCASAHGRGIHFPDDELRSMGTRAKGVNVMDVGEPQDRVVAAFSARRTEHVAVLTRDGLGKRVEFSEFRQQGRAGAGMQLARLDKEDRIVGAAPCHPSDDLVIATDAGRICRRPAGTFPLMGRPAKGDRQFEFDDGERVLEFASLPCGSD